jgi:hypothetical protein
MTKDKQSLSASDLAALLDQRRAVVFVGAGVSLRKDVPSLGRADAQSTGFTHRVGPHSKPKKRLDEAASYGAAGVGARSLLRHLCDWPISAIVTTNYDDLIERSLSEVGKSVSRILTPWELGTLDSEGSSVAVVKLHGDASVPESVALGNENADLRRTLRERLVERIHELFPSELKLFVGFSSNDPILPGLVDPKGRRRTRVANIFIGRRNELMAPEIEGLFDVHLTFTASERDSFLAHVTEGLAKRSRVQSSSRLFQGILEVYRRLVRQVSRLGWTVEPNHAILVDDLPLRIRFHPRPLTNLLDGQADSDPRAPTAIDYAWSSLLQQVQNHPVTIIVGEPGSGKTTLLQALVRDLASNHEAGSLFPVFLKAPDLAESDVSSYSALFDRAEVRTGITGLAAALKDSLTKSRCALVVDGLDELDHASMGRLVQTLREVTAMFPDSRCVASSRWHGYESVLSHSADLFVSLSSLKRPEINRFVYNWFSKKTEAEELVCLLACNPSVFDLATRPLFLNLLVYSWSERKAAPVSVWSLCGRATNLLLGSWDWEKAVFRSNRFPAMLHSTALSACAASMILRDSTVLSTQFALEHLRESAVLEEMSIQDIAFLLEECEERTGLLIRSGDERWSFAHGLFREYFAAEFVLNNPLDIVARMIARSAEVRSWVPTLALALSSSESGATIVREILKRVPGIPSTNVTDEASALSCQSAPASPSRRMSPDARLTR